MSETPRTDAAITDARMPDQVYKRTMYDHIQVIERELTEARKQRDTLAEALCKCRKYMNEEIDTLPFYVIDDALAVMKGGES
jgi:hypothetical protein